MNDSNDTPMGTSRYLGTFVLVLMLLSAWSVNTSSAHTPTLPEPIHAAAAEIEPIDAESIELETDVVAGEIDICVFDAPDKPEYKSSLIQLEQQRFFKKGGTGEISVIIKNEGNMPWFSAEAKCSKEPTVWLGTLRKKDRDSSFYNPAAQSGWHSANRIKMDALVVNPGEQVEFRFDALANVKEDYYKEYFAPLVDGVTWMEESTVEVDIQVGALQEAGDVINEKRQMMYFSMPASELNLDGVHTIHLDIKAQKMYAMIDDVLVNVMTSSTGAYDTPTPLGEMVVSGKDRVRIGGAAPHYIMPYFLQLRRENGRFRGYGIHDFPAYGNANMRATVRKLLAEGKEVPNSVYASDWMWNGAKYDMGRRVSHGCIRNDNAPFVYNFMDVGDMVIIYSSLPEDHAIREQLSI